MMAIPGPPLHPTLGLYGNLIQFYQDPIAYMVMLKHDYGNFSGIVANNKQFLFLFGGEANKALLMNPESFSLAGAPGAPGLENIHRMHELNISHMTGSQHQQQRQILRQAIQSVDKHQRQIIMNQVMALLVEQVSQQRSFGLVTMIKRMLFYMDWQLLFSADRDFPPLQALLMELTELTGEVSFYNMKPQALQHLNQRLGQLPSVFQQFSAAIPPSGRDFYSLLLDIYQRDEPLSQLQFLAHLYTLYTASHDTTSSALISTFILIALHPAVWPRLQAELQSVLGAEPPTFEQLSQLTYLESLIQESLRILPASSILARYCQQDFVYQDTLIPKGATCFLSQYISHRDPDVFDNPRKFRPERWAADLPGRFDFIPFGTGFHRCLGAESAMAKMKTILALFFQHFALELAPQTTIDYQLKVTLYPKQEVFMTVRQPHEPLAPVVDLRGNILDMIER